MKTRTINQTVTFKASPDAVYEAIMDPKKHAKFSGSKATISRKVGAEFSAYDAYLTGKILELEPDKRIVLSLRHEDEGWPKDHHTRATFFFSRIKEGTRLDFTQTEVPEANYADIEEGWRDFYWEPIKAMLEKQ